MDRNVFQMTEYRPDAGYSALSQIEAYWEALRGNRLVPKRAEIDPRGIENILENTFILERITTGMARIRIAGSHLSDLMGMEVRGMPLTTFISTESRCQIGDILEDVFQRPSVCELRLSAEINRHKPPMEARMLLLPLKSDMGDVSRVLGCLVAHGKIGQSPRRFNITGTKIRPLLRHLDKTEDTQSTAQTPPHAVSKSQVNLASLRASVTRAGGRSSHLRLVKSD